MLYSGDTWSEEAIDFFESLTFDLDSKKPLLAKSQGYCENADGFIPRIILKSTDVILYIIYFVYGGASLTIK